MCRGSVNGIVNQSGGVELIGLSIKVEGGVNGLSTKVELMGYSTTMEGWS